ncbi:MAG: hypothetical protein IT392_02775 [Nitrospirae bacterium]|nr:hypothetical protein [Nitrospirota bacterium]
MPSLIALIVFIISIVTPVVSSGEINLNSGHLSAAESIELNHLASIFDNPAGDQTLHRFLSDNDMKQDATMTVMGIRKRWGELSPEFKEIASKYFLSKPAQLNSQFLPKTPPGSIKSVRGTHLLPNWVETEHFNIEWGNNLFNGDRGADSDKIISCSAGFNSGSVCSGVPDLVDKWANYLEEVWSYETKYLGYVEPTGTEMYLFDVYIANTRDKMTGNDDDLTPSLGFNYLGLTVTYCDKNYFQICKDDNQHVPYSYIVVNNSYSDDQTIKITAAHEFFHAIQFSYPSIDKWWSSPSDHWWIEASATWMEEAVYDEVNNYYARIRSWLRSPELSLKNDGGSNSDHKYGDVIFILYLTDVYLKNRDFVRSVWERDEGGIDAIKNVLATEMYGQVDFESAFRAFVALNAVADIGETYGGYEEGKQYGRAAVTKEHKEYPVASSVSSSSAPHELGANYIHFLPPGNDNKRLTIQFDGSDGINWAAMLVKVRSDGEGFERDDLAIDQTHKSGCLSMDGFGSDYSEVFLVSSVLIDPGLTETAPYSYKAALGNSCPDAEIQAFYLPQDPKINPAINDSSDKRCFIATAAFGSSGSPYVRILRDFRDHYLMTFNHGRAFVAAYYSVSPHIAELLEKHPPAPLIVRYALFPVIGIAYLFLNPALSAGIFFVVFLLSVLTLIIYSRKALKKV